MGKAIALATPVFFLLIALEWCIARVRQRRVYRLNDAVNSLSLGVMSRIVDLFAKALTVGLYAWLFERFALALWPMDRWWAWLGAIVFYDFCYYWNHRLGHESAVFWAAHVVHHQSQCYNLTTALRQTSSSALLSWIFYVPMAIAGVPPAMFVVAAIVDLLYQYWIHTELIGKLGPLDRWLATPSNHRVHHAVNDRYIDRNYGGIFMAWDRLFGTFVEETEPCVYGTRAPLNSWDPFWANFEVYADLLRKTRACTNWGDRLRVWWKPPGWQPAQPGATRHRTHFDLGSVRTYDPPLTRRLAVFAVLQLTAVILSTVALLWFADTLAPAVLGVVALAAMVVLWLIGAVMQGRLRMVLAIGAEVTLLGVLLFTAGNAFAGDIPTVFDDAHVQRAVDRARSQYLAEQSFDRLQVSVLVKDPNGRWAHGSYQGDLPAYPASVVKLGFLVGAVHWCQEQGKPPECLDQYVRPMIVESDNVATGYVVDAVSGMTNVPVEGADVEQWIERRRYTEHVLAAAGLLGSQRLFTKTYPTNSGEEPSELERLAWQRLGRNAMTPDLTAQLMLAIVSGAIEPQATDYMRALLRRPRFSAHSGLGGGLPPGSDYENKPGSAFDTLQDVMYARLPSGRELIVAVFSNGLDASEREPWDVARINDFALRLVHELGLEPRDPPSRIIEPSRVDADAIHWRWHTHAAGRYELAAWYDADPANTTRAVGRLMPTAQDADTTLDESTWGRRWIRLGDFQVARGATEFTLTRAATGRLVPARLRITAWPRE